MTEQEIHTICEQYGITNYTINDDMSIDVDGDVHLWDSEMKKLPLKFRKVSGWFKCSFNQLSTLEGCPIEVGNYFACDYNKLTSLEGCPTKVGGDFGCECNLLTSLESGPKFIGGTFYCFNNPIYEEFKTEFNSDYNLYLKTKDIKPIG